MGLEYSQKGQFCFAEVLYLGVSEVDWSVQWLEDVT